MTDSDREALLLASRLLEYPDEAYFAELGELCGSESLANENAAAVKVFCRDLLAVGREKAREEYVRVFDHDPDASLYLTWHRYGNDRSQGRAMAGLNGLYRAAGFEPLSGTMPDYLPRMLEFLAVCDEWAIEALLDGFGPELAKLRKNIADRGARHAPILEMALAPLEKDFPKLFKPRNRPDPTIRPMACPEKEILPR